MFRGDRVSSLASLRGRARPLDGLSVASAPRIASFFEAVVSDRQSEEHELTEMESQVLLALYSGVSPFEMADLVSTAGFHGDSSTSPAY